MPSPQPAAQPDARTHPASTRSAEWALLFGNFAIGCGIMVVGGTLNNLAQSLAVSVASAGQLITAGAAAVAVGAPLAAAAVAGMDRRRLLTWSLVWYAIGHLLAALMPSYGTLMPVRALGLLAAAVFTPQAAAALSVMVPPEQRGRAITFIFLGWSISSVVGLPMAAWLGEVLGWRWAFIGATVLALLAAVAVWRTVPDGVRPAALSRASWAQVFTQPGPLAVVLVTALTSAGQFTLMAYLAPYFRQVLNATPNQVSLLFLWFGAMGVLGNMLMSRHIDRLGAGRTVAITLLCIGATMLAWPLAGSMVAMLIVLTPWALGCFSSNSAQQARLVLIAPMLAPALIALNSSAIYLGQALGAASGGAIIAQYGYDPLHWVAMVWLVAAVVLSQWASRRLQHSRQVPVHSA
ncbi:MAG: MFS transporter [Burkholderiales bacterium]